MPGADVVAVVAEAGRRSQAVAEVLERPLRIRVDVVVIAEDRARPRQVAAPGCRVILRIRRVGSIRENVVTGCEDGPGDRVHQLRGELLVAVLPRDVPGPHQDRRGFQRDCRRCLGGILRALRVRHDERNVVAAGLPIRVRHLGVVAARAVAKVPAIRECVAVRIRRLRAVDTDHAGRGVVRAARDGDRRMVRRRWWWRGRR